MGVEALFPFTKFLPPLLDDRIVGGRAVERLHAAVEAHPVTVVSAPAGSGKTTALASWARESEVPVVWVRIGPGDDTPTVAAAAVLAGVRRLVDSFGVRLERMLTQAETTASPQHLLTSLVNDLGDAPALRLVLDDFHEIVEPGCLALFDALADHLPHETRLLIASRTQPELSLARRRVRGELAELGLEDLRLDAEAVRALVARHGAVNDDEAEAIAKGTNGWAAAVRLAMARLAAGIEEPTEAGLDPVVAVQPDLWRFLTEEVLEAQPPGLQAFLLDTSILDELTPAACASVAGRPNAGAVLEELDRRNLFVTRFAGEDDLTWRYHDLFATFLRDRLTVERSRSEIAALHRRAADALPATRAVPHLLAAGDHDHAAAIALEVAFASAEPSVLPVVLPWLEALPPPIADRHHRIPLLLAWNDELHGRPEEILARLEPIHARLRAAGESVAAAETGIQLAAGYFMLGRRDQLTQVLDEALVQPLEGLWHIAALALRLHVARERGDWAAASKDLEDAVTLALNTDDPTASSVLASALSWRLLFADQGPRWVRAHADRLAHRLDAWDCAVALTQLRPLTACAALLQLELDAARDETRRCLAESREVGMLAWTHQKAEALLVALSLAAGDHATVRGVADEAFARMEDSPVDVAMRHVYAHATLRLAWRRRDRQQLRTVSDLLAVPAGFEEEIVRLVAEALGARLDGRSREAIESLREAETVQHSSRCWIGVGLPGLEAAGILMEQGRSADALEAVEPTLAAAAQLGAGLLLAEAPSHARLLERCAEVGPHRDVAAAVLAALERRAAPVAVPGTGETLSARELEVLTHVARGKSNREIAAALFISEVTVKSHLTRILRKLDATSRTHAVARARELNLR